jgi:VIT family
VKNFSPLDQRYLDPASSLAEMLFGLIMTLTFTLGAGIIIEDEGREGARQLLIAIIGCNLAWGIIDAALYLVDELFDRGRLRRLGLAVQREPDDSAAMALVGSELDETLEDVTSASERETLYRRIVENVRKKENRARPLTRDDWMGALTSFWLVVITSAPAAVPFLLFDDARFALRVSNAILLAILFVTGYWWARYAVGRPWLVGTGLLAGGIVLVGVAILLGG